MENQLSHEDRKLKHVTWVSGYSFLGSVLTFLMALIFVPMPDFAQDPPVIPDLLMTFGQIGTSLLIMGCVAYATKLTEERNTMSSIGFTLMSVAQGIIFVLYIISFNGEEKIAEAYRIFSASLYLLIFSILLISFFSDFPKWIKILGAVACLPYVTENILYSVEGKLSPKLMYIDAAGNFLFNLTVACWGVLVLRGLKKELKLRNQI
jgi:Na+/melibiose symporter-like transporter